MFCPKCGTELNNDAVICDNCGESMIETAEVSATQNAVNHIPYQDTYYSRQRQPRNSIDISSLVLGVTSLIFFSVRVVGGILGIFAIALSIASIKKERSLTGWAIAGLVLGISGLAIHTMRYFNIDIWMN